MNLTMLMSTSDGFKELEAEIIKPSTIVWWVVSYKAALKF